MNAIATILRHLLDLLRQEPNNRTTARGLRFEQCEDRRLLAANVLDHSLPDTRAATSPRHDASFASTVVDGASRHSADQQIVYVDADGASGISYRGPVLVDNLDVPPFSAAGWGWGGYEQSLLDLTLEYLEPWATAHRVRLTLTPPDPAQPFSTIYLGGDDRAFAEHGRFLGLAEKVDVGNLDHRDRAFVFTENLQSWGPVDHWASAVSLLGDVMAHEIGHLLGEEHSFHDEADRLAHSALDGVALLTPSLVSPSDGAQQQSPNPTLAWSQVSGANLYRVLVATSQSALPAGAEDPVSGPALVVNTTTASTSYTLSTSETLQAGTTYFWQVRAGNTVTQEGSFWSDRRSFTTALPGLPAPALISPSSGATAQPTRPHFDWGTVSGANAYRLLIATTPSALPRGEEDPVDSPSLVVNAVVSDSDHLLTVAESLQEGVTYYWQVRAGNSATGQGGIWSGYRSFTTVLPGLPAPTLISPSSGATGQPTRPNFDWSDVTGANAYRLLIATTPSALPRGEEDPVDSSSLVVNAVVSDSDHLLTVAESLQEGVTYYWQVRAGNSATGQGGVWSGYRSFTTVLPGLPAPTLISPSSGATGQPTRPNFDWSDVTGANAYRLLIATTPSALPRGEEDPVDSSSLVVNAVVSDSDHLLTVAESLQEGVTYYWQVRAGNSATGQGGVWSGYRSLTTTVTAADISTGDFVRTTTGADVRSMAGLTANEITEPDYAGQAPAQTLGVVIEGPNSSDGLTWWRVDFGPGRYTGWVRQDRIVATDLPYVRGIDVSHHQGSIDWSKVAQAGIKFAIIKATEGDGAGLADPVAEHALDSRFFTNIGSATSAGLHVGAYHFARPDLNNSAEDEAAWFVSQAGDYIGDGFLPPVLDVEHPATTVSTAPLSAWVDTWLDEVQRLAGVRPVLYASSSHLPHINQDPAETELWIAHWRYNLEDTPDIRDWDRWELWQYSGDAPTDLPGEQASIIPGVDRQAVDANVFNGSYADFLAWIRSDTLPAPTLVSPSDGVGNVTVPPRFTWDPVQGANTYRILVATTPAALPSGQEDPSPSSELIVNSTTGETGFTPPAGLFDSETTYYWQVRSGNTEGGGSVWSRTWSFTTATTSHSVTPQSLPYHQDFAGGMPGSSEGWEFYSSDSRGRIEVDGQRLEMDVHRGGLPVLNEAILHVDLAGQTGVILQFDHDDVNDEDHALPAQFSGHHGGDGIAISVDGSTWHRLVSLQGDLTGHVIDLDAVAQAAGFSFTDDVRIKFQQQDNYGMPVDGRAFDNILVSAGNAARPETPGGLTATAQGSDSILISWSEVERAQRYTLQRGPSEDGPWGTIFAGQATQHLDQGLEAATTYFYRVRASNDAGHSGDSDSVSETTHATPAATPQDVPYVQDFSTGLPTAEQGWQYYSSDDAGRIRVNGDRLEMDVRTNRIASLNEAILHLDLESATGVRLTFDHDDVSDEDHGLPAQFTEHAEGDGVAISVDGSTWYTLLELQGDLTGHTIDLDAELQARGLQYTGNVRIKFQQFDNFSMRTDGRAFDNIAVSVGASAPGDDNDQISEAVYLGAMTEDRGWSSGRIDSPTDVDMFSFTVSAGQRIGIDTDRLPDSRIDTFLRLFDVSGRELDVNDDRSAPGEGGSVESYLEFTFQEAGTYFVGVSGYRNHHYDPVSGERDREGSTGGYSLELTSLVDIRAMQPLPDYTSPRHLGNDYITNLNDTSQDVGRPVVAPVSGRVVFAGQYGSGAGYGDLLVAIEVPLDPQTPIVREDGAARPVSEGTATVFLGHLSEARYTADNRVVPDARRIELQVGQQVVAGETQLGYVAPFARMGTGTDPHVHVGIVPGSESAGGPAPFVTASGVATHFPGFWDPNDGRTAPEQVDGRTATYYEWVRSRLLAPPLTWDGWSNF